MKITTWNVNGFRAVIKKDFKKSIEYLSPDILCLQETKAKLEQLSEEDYYLPGYRMVWNAAQRPGYSGVALYHREELAIDETICGLGNDEFDVEGRAIQVILNDTILFNNYFPNGQRGMDRVDYKLRYYAWLLDKCIKLHEAGKNIIITGDFNTAHNDIDLANPKENSKTSGFLPEEREWIDIYLRNQFKDAYRELYPDRVQYTWWTYRFTARVRNIGWRLDYFLVSDGFMERVEDVIVHEEVLGSDHCPVSIIIK